MTAVVNPSVATRSLGDNDYVVTAEEPRPSLTSSPAAWGMSVNFHLRAETPLLACVYRDQDRITVGLGGVADDLTLFLHTDQLDRLITVLHAARRRLR